MINKNQNKKIILTCAQPTGQLHLGNYLGAINNWKNYLLDNECFFGVVDLHAITIKNNKEIEKNTLDCVAQYIACGLDPDKCTIFIQSHIRGHTELSWILGCMTSLGQLERMTQFKSKIQNNKNEINSGLLFYPILMASDILLYNADIVPVGDDQKQHLELTRDLARIFNKKYSETFKIPKIIIQKFGSRIMSLQNPLKKMSKSDSNKNNVIYLLDNEKILKSKIMGAITDSFNKIKKSNNNPGISNLIDIMSLLTKKSISAIEEEFKGKGYGYFKSILFEEIIHLIKPIQFKYEAIRKNESYLKQIIEKGNKIAQIKAYKTLSNVYEKIGLLNV